VWREGDVALQSTMCIWCLRKLFNGSGHIVYCQVFVYVGDRAVVENLEKSWNFKMVVSRPGKVLEKT